MSNSSLVNYTRISPNRNSPRNHKIDTITIHCVVGQCSVETLGNIFANSNIEASSNYGVGYDGRIGMYVEEKDRSWCSSSASNDNRAITIEVASDTYHPYAVNDAAYEALIKLVADICRRNGIKELKWKADKSLIGQVDKQNMTVHRWFANKSCPGDYLYSRHGDIAKRVNALLGASGGSNQAVELKVGNTINFLGGKVYNSAYAAIPKTTNCKAGPAKITVVHSGKHPYHIVHTDSQSSVYGWVDAASISGAAMSAVTPVITTPVETSYTPNMPTLRKGSTGSIVKNLQFILNGVGFNCGTADGDYGAKTVSAMKAYQKKYGLTADGVCGPKTWKNMLGSSMPTIKNGTKNWYVKILQSLLNGYDFKCGSVDGIFGSGTEAALRKYQTNRGLTSDGICGPKTWAQLLK